MQSVFSLNAKKVQMCINVSGEFAVITQRYEKNPAAFVNFFTVAKFLESIVSCERQ